MNNKDASPYVNCSGKVLYHRLSMVIHEDLRPLWDSWRAKFAGASHPFLQRIVNLTFNQFAQLQRDALHRRHGLRVVVLPGGLKEVRRGGVAVVSSARV